MEGFLRSSEFETYRQLMLEEIASFINSRLFGDTTDLQEIKGCIELARIITRLPLKIKREEFVKEMIQKDLKTFETSFIRKSLEESLIKKETK